MKTFIVLLVLHLENRIPITRDDTHRRSIAMTLLWAKQPSMPRGSKRRACQTRPQGRNGYGDGQTQAKGSHRKKRPLNCCNSSTARCVSENTAQSVFSLSERPPKRKNNFSMYLKMIGGIEMKMSVCKSYGDLPLFLNAKLVAQVLGVSISTAYEVMHESSFPTLRVGSRMVVPKEKFIQWAEEQSGGAK